MRNCKCVYKVVCVCVCVDKTRQEDHLISRNVQKRKKKK